jgi:hypothetical protein
MIFEAAPLQYPVIIPTRCPKFAAACLTCGVELEKGTPGVDNVYSKAVKYDPDEPGSISFYLSDKQGINPLALAKVWTTWTPDLDEAATIPARILAIRTQDDANEVAGLIEQLTVLSAVAHMRLFSLSRFSIDSPHVSEAESAAARKLSDFPDLLRKNPRTAKKTLVKAVFECWQPAMFAWVKAWISNYREIRDLWQSARPAIKFEREGRLPLVIPKGKNFETLIRRWKH